MKDKNGIEFQVGDVCVDHTRIEGDFGELCVVVENTFDIYNQTDNPCLQYFDEILHPCNWRGGHLLEIIGSVR